MDATNIIFPSTDIFKVIAIDRISEQTHIYVQSKQQESLCPKCSQVSKKLHSYYISQCGSTVSLSKYLPHDPQCVDNLAKKGDTASAMKTVDIKTEGETMDINLYPNPAVDRSVTITTPDEGTYDLVLFDFNYQMVFRKNRCVYKEHTLDISSYQPGMYFVYLMSKERTYSKKLIIQK